MDFSKLKEKALNITNKAIEFSQDVAKKAIKAKDTAIEKIEENKNKASEMKENTVSKANDIKNKAEWIKQQATDLKDKTVSKANDLKEQAANKTSELKDKAEWVKQQANDLKDKVIEKKDETVKKWKEWFFSIKFWINNKEELDFLIKKSATTSFVNKETGEEKFFKHKSIVIFAEEWSDFVKKSYFIVPILTTKAYSQNITIKFAKSVIEWVNLKDYNVDVNSLPCMVVFEEQKIIKNIEWQENILKLVKSIDLDINKLIEEA